MRSKNIEMEKGKKLYMQLKVFLKEVFVPLHKFSKRSFFIACIWLLFVSNGFAQENLNSEVTASSSFLDMKEKGRHSSKEIAGSQTSVSTVQEEVNFSRRNSNEENLELSVSSLSDSIPDSHLGLSIVGSEKVGSFSQTSQLSNGTSEVSERSNATKKNSEALENTLSLETFGNDSAINKIQRLIDKDSRKRGVDSSTTEKRSNERELSPSLTNEESNRAIDKIQDFIEEKKGYQNTNAERNDQAVKKSASNSVHLFNTVDFFRTPVEGHAPKWERVLNLEKKKSLFLALVLKKECLIKYINVG